MLYKVYHKIQFIGLALLLVLFIGACDSNSQSTEEPTATLVPPTEEVEDVSTSVPSTEEDTLRLLFWQTPSTLNTHLTSAGKDTWPARLVYEPLASFDKSGNLIPFLAAEIPTPENGGVAQDGKSVTWKLKEGVKWADGELFTAEDVKFTYEFVTNPEVASPTASAYEDIESVEIIDDLTVKINFKDITPAWSKPFVGGETGVILPRHLFADYNGSNAMEAPVNLNAIGTGPYYVVEFATEDILMIGSDVVETVKIVFEANPFFRETGKPYFKYVEVQGGGDAEVAARAVMEEGNVDYAYNIQVEGDVLQELEKLGKGIVLNNPGPYLERIWFNHSDPNQATTEGEFSNLEFPHPFFSDLRVRQAFAYAINREPIGELYGTTGSLTDNVMIARPPYQAGVSTVPNEFNLEKAASLLDEAGWMDTDGDGIRDKDGVKMKVLFQTSVNPLREQVLEIIKLALEKIGVEVELKLVESSVFFQRDLANTSNIWHFYADMQLFAWGDPTPDPERYLGYWTCNQIPQLSNDWTGDNFERWCNSDYDDLYQRMATEIDPEERTKLILQMVNMLNEEIVTISLIQRSFPSAASNAIDGIDLTPWDVDTWNIKDWKRK